MYIGYAYGILYSCLLFLKIFIGKSGEEYEQLPPSRQNGATLLMGQNGTIFESNADISNTWIYNATCKRLLAKLLIWMSKYDLHVALSAQSACDVHINIFILSQSLNLRLLCKAKLNRSSSMHRKFIASIVQMRSCFILQPLTFWIYVWQHRHVDLLLTDVSMKSVILYGAVCVVRDLRKRMATTTMINAQVMEQTDWLNA